MNRTSVYPNQMGVLNCQRGGRANYEMRGKMSTTFIRKFATQFELHSTKAFFATADGWRARY